MIPMRNTLLNCHIRILFIRHIALVAAIIIATAAPAGLKAIDITDPAVHCENDTADINRMIRLLAQKGGTPSERRAEAVRMLEGAPLDMSERQDSVWQLRLNVHTFTPLSFINCVQALVRASMTPDADWRTFTKEYVNLSTRQGEDDGFSSMLRYGSEWIADNIYRGNLKEMTENYEGALSKTKSLDYMSRHREEFAPLSDPETFDKVEMKEMGLKMHRLPYLKRHYISRPDVDGDLRGGDVILLLTNADGEDIFRIGYVIQNGNGKFLAGMNVDKNAPKVEIDNITIDRLFKLMAKNFFGFRAVRWTD